MASFIELARRALSANTSIAAAAAVAALSLHATTKPRSKSKALCDVEMPRFNNNRTERQRQEQTQSPQVSRRGTALHSREIRPARDMKETYVIDWKTVLGEGAYGRVYPGRHGTTGDKVALKKISKRCTNSSSFRSETDALLRIYENGGHPNISGLRDIYEDNHYYYLILDLVSGGEMFEHLVQYGSYSEDDASRLVQEILSALAFLHNIGVIHADLKPENILLCEERRGDETIKIIDFGCAKVDKERGDYYSHRQSPRMHNDQFAVAPAASIGTKAYWPPELFKEGASVTESIDIWAVGVIVYIMLVGVHPFDPKGIASDQEIEEQIKTNPVPPMSSALTSHLSPSAKDFLKCLMTPDPEQRMTALASLRHPWIRGERTPTEKLMGSDLKLAMYQDYQCLREKLAVGVFAALVDHDDTFENSSRTHILKRAFEVFDAQKKGFIDEADLGRVITKVTGSSLSRNDEKNIMTMVKKSSSSSRGSTSGLSLSDFSKITRLSHEHFPRGQYIYQAGDEGDSMYFINSGKVEILTKSGQLLSILRHGDFFGEGSLLEDRNYRYCSARCSTPVDVIKVSREEFNRYITSSSQTKQSIRLKYRNRTLRQAKQLIRLQTNLTQKTLSKGDVVYQVGDMGESMFLVDESNGGRLEVKAAGKTAHVLCPGDTFGESALLFRRPRSSTVICATDQCHLHELNGLAFFKMLESDPNTEIVLNTEAKKRTWD